MRLTSQRLTAPMRALTCAAAAVIAIAFALLMSEPAAAWTAQNATMGLIVDGGAVADTLSLADGDNGSLVVLDEATRFEGALPAGCSALPDSDGHGVQCDRAGVVSVTLRGGEGPDAIQTLASGVAVTLLGQAGDDRLTGSDGPDTLDGGDGSDTVDGAGGNDTLVGGAGDDALSGAAGDDDLDAGSGTDDVDGGDGDDRLSGGDGTDALNAGRGADTVDGGNDNDDLSGGDGADDLRGGAGADRIDGGLDDDTAAGGAGDDALEGTDGHDTLHGDDGNDTLTAGPAGTVLDAGAGDDQLQGADGDDQLLGGPGSDVLDAQGGADRLDGGDGDDTLTGGDGADFMSGGAGRDSVTYADAAGGVSASLDERPDDGQPGEADFIASDVEVLVGSGDDDVLAAGAAGTVLRGGDGDDLLSGGAGPDELDGGSGTDRLRGGAGADQLVGGQGRDTALYDDRRAAVSVSAGEGTGDDGARDEHDTVAGDVESVTGGRGADVLIGSRDHPGTLDGGAGDDSLIARSPAPPDTTTLRCGEGNDRAHARAADLVLSDCESVWRDGQRTRFGVTAPGRPTLFLDARSLRFDRHGAVRIRLRCTRSARALCRGTLRISDGGRLLGRTRLALLPGTRATLKLRAKQRRRASYVRRHPHGTLVDVRILLAGSRRAGRLTATLPLRRT